jgi:uncharacterized protein (TIGR00251 family)
VRLRVRVTPRSSRTEIVGWDATGTLQVRVKAPPVDGEANAALIDCLARAASVPKATIMVVRGAGGRLKTIAIEGIEAEEFRRRLESADRDS